MSEILSTSLRHEGLLPAASLHELGLGPNAIAALVRRRELKCVRRGVYVDGRLWRECSPDERYRLFLRATALISPPRGAVSHLSAAALHGLPLIGTWPASLHATDSCATGGSSARFVTMHRGREFEPVEIRGIAVTSLARTLVDIAASASFLVAVTMLDHTLRGDAARGVPALTQDELFAELEYVRPRRGFLRAERAIAFANPLAANPGESLSRVRIFELGFEVPELQVCFPEVDGHDYWVDFYWRRIRKIGEFDGMHKYTRGAILGDRDPADVVVAEKLREDKLRPLAASFDRWDWDTALSPQRFYAFLTDHGVPRV